jgi:hypothetical protein
MKLSFIVALNHVQLLLKATEIAFRTCWILLLLSKTTRIFQCEAEGGKTSFSVMVINLNEFLSWGKTFRRVSQLG